MDKDSPSSSFTTNPISSGPITPPLLMSYRDYHLFVLKNIRDFFDFHLKNATQNSDQFKLDFDRKLELKEFSPTEEIAYIKAECNRVSDLIIEEGSRIQFSEFLDEEKRAEKLGAEISNLEEVSDLDFFIELQTKSINASHGDIPEMVDAQFMESSFIRLYQIWGNKLFYDYLKSLLTKLEQTENSETIAPLPEKNAPPTIQLKSSVCDEVINLLSPYFESATISDKEVEEKLKRILSEKTIDGKLIFRSEAISLAYFFKELIEHNYILSNKTVVAKWLVHYFQVQTDSNVDPKDLSKSYVYRILTDDCSPPKSYIEIPFIDN